MNAFEPPRENHTLIAAKPTWQDDVLFICRKCMRKQRDGADGEGTRLSKWLRRELKREGTGTRVRVLEVGCFDLCPKRGVTMARGRDLATVAKPLRVLRWNEDPRRVVHWLLDKP